MMLWHKAWLESRVRFLLGVTMMTAVCAYSVYAHRSAYQGIVRNVFMVLCFLLGVGGLLRERAVGTAPFTLALPVSRVRLMATRAAVGWLELVALAFVPLMIAMSLSPLVGDRFGIGQGVRVSAMWVTGGSALLAVAFLASSLFAGEYTAFVIAWIVLFAHTIGTQLARLARPALLPYLFTVQEIMSGFRGPVPSTITAALVVVTCALVASAVLVIDQKDF